MRVITNEEVSGLFKDYMFGIGVVGELDSRLYERKERQIRNYGRSFHQEFIKYGTVKRLLKLKDTKDMGPQLIKTIDFLLKEEIERREEECGIK